MDEANDRKMDENQQQREQEGDGNDADEEETNQVQQQTRKTLIMSPSHILYQQQPCNSDIPYNTITPRSPKRSASFSPHVRVKRTLHINNYSDDLLGMGIPIFNESTMRSTIRWI